MRIENEYIYLISTHKRVRWNISEILYFESYKNNLIAFTADDSIEFRGKMFEFEDELADKGFIRIHKGVLVNSQKIKKIGKRIAVMENDKLLPVSKARLDNVKKQYSYYSEQQMQISM